MPYRLFCRSNFVPFRTRTVRRPSAHPTLACLLLLLAGTNAHASPDCDELASRIFRKAIREALEQLGCAELGRVGLEANHILQSVCYASTGKSSSWRWS